MARAAKQAPDYATAPALRADPLAHPGYENSLNVIGSETYRPVFTRVQSRLITRCTAGSRAVMTNSFLIVASSG
jgi:hypothetical protein